MTVLNVVDAVNNSIYKDKPISSWRSILMNECQVYVFGENYIAKRFDQIHFKFCDKNEAKDVLIDNLYALLRYKYFPKTTDEIDDKISKIVSSFCQNLKTSLKKVSFDKDTDAEQVNMIPDYCVAFRNGVYDFLHNKFLFKYDVIQLENLKNKIYLYDNKYIILWYLNFNFDAFPVSIKDTSLLQFIDIMKELTKSQHNYCFELMYNISHDIDNKFSITRFTHLCEIIGYLLLVSFSQNFIFLIGSGQNGKNSLFDGCFTHKVVPSPASNDILAFENDRFITGSLENKAHNIFLETPPKTITDSTMLKAITGSMYQTIEQKGVNKYTSIINCKYVFAGNDQDKIKFTDNTIGFRRRINMFEIWYRWDKQKRFLSLGDYYDTSFSDTLKEIKSDISNTVIFVYFGMYGLMNATKNFTKNFEFNSNDWRLQYTDIDIDLQSKFDNLDFLTILKYMTSHTEEGKTVLFDSHKKRLYDNLSMHDLGGNSYDTMLNVLSNEETRVEFFSENDVFISIRAIQILCNNFSAAITFTQNVKKLFTSAIIVNIYNNKPYIKCRIDNTVLKVIS